MKINYVVLAALVALLVGGALLTRYSADGKESDKGLDFTLKDTEGKSVTLSDYRGKLVIVDVWATWCGYCVREIPDLIAIQEQAYKDAGKDKKDAKLQIIGISVDSDKAAVKPFVKEHKINYPVVYATKDALKQFGEIPGLPTKFILDKKGRIVEKIIGAREAAELQKIIEKHLKK